jgi:2-oxoglutarate ferredoxin oxidoreductase subunit gamma
MVMVGAIVGLTSVVDTTCVEEAIRKYVPRGTESLNLDAFRSGYDYVRRPAPEQVVTTQETS